MAGMSRLIHRTPSCWLLHLNPMRCSSPEPTSSGSSYRLTFARKLLTIFKVAQYPTSEFSPPAFLEAPSRYWPALLLTRRVLGCGSLLRQWSTHVPSEHEVELGYACAEDVHGQPRRPQVRRRCSRRPNRYKSEEDKRTGNSTLLPWSFCSKCAILEKRFPRRFSIRLSAHDLPPAIPPSPARCVTPVPGASTSIQ